MMSLVEPSVRPDWTKKSISNHFFDFLTVPVFKIKHSPINLRFQNKLTQNLKKKMTLDQKKKKPYEESANSTRAICCRDGRVCSTLLHNFTNCILIRGHKNQVL